MTTHHFPICCAALGLLLALGAATTPAAAQEPEAQRFAVPFSDPSRPGRLEIGLVSGSITIEAYDGKEVLLEVRAEAAKDQRPRAREGREGKNTEGMKVIANAGFGISVEEQDNVMEVSSDSWRRRVDITARVPQRTALELSTVNQGDIVVTGVSGEIEISNVDGSIIARGVSGSVVAETVSGAVTVELRQVEAGKAMAFSSLNGDIDLTLPAATKAEVVVEAGGGSIYSDFDLALSRTPINVRKEQAGGKTRIEVSTEVRGTLNGGGPELRFETVGGDIYLRKAK